MSRTFIAYAIIVCVAMAATTTVLLIGNRNLIFIVVLFVFFGPVAVLRVLREWEAVKILKEIRLRCRCGERMFYSYRTNGFRCEGCGQYVYWKDVFEENGFEIGDNMFSLADAIQQGQIKLRKAEEFEQLREQRRQKPDVS